MVFGIFGKKKEAKEDRLLVGEVIHYFRKIKVAVIKINKQKIAIGDEVWFNGHTTDFGEKIKSMQIDHEAVESAGKGKEAAIKVKKKVRRGDKVLVSR